MDVQQPRGIIATYRALDAAEVACIAQSLFQTQGHVMMAHTTDVQFLRLANLQLDTELLKWDEGRFFCDKLEMRWRRLTDGQFSLLILTENEAYVPSNWELLSQSWHAIDHGAQNALRLWGKRQETVAQWVEVRIPRLLSYPVSASQPSVNVSWIEYRDEQGAPRLMRLKGVSDADNGA